MRKTVAMVTSLLGLAAAGTCGTEAFAQGERSIALIIDASGSMNARLPDGSTRIDAAKSAVAELAGKLPGETRIALRAYGHQSPTPQKNCRDTALVVGFERAATNRSAVIAAARGLRAQGYTPITHALTLAAADVGNEEAAIRAVVLVSDGRETCAADPCAAARALAAADARLAIHTIGLAVDAAARFQLRCIASVARGIYVDAADTSQLVAALSKAMEAAPRKPLETVTAGKPGRIRIEGAPPASHEVIDAATGAVVGRINTGHPGEIELPAGIYNVRFQNGPWMGVEVKDGATTLLKPGFLKIEGRDPWGNRLLDPETNEMIGQPAAGYDRVALMPTRVVVTFGSLHKLTWPDLVEIREGATTTLRPGRIRLHAAKVFKATVRAADGAVIGEISSAIHTAALPAGRYTLGFNAADMPFELAEGQDLEIKLP